MIALLSPLALVALVAWLVPLAIHLLRQPERKVVDFAALRWLRPRHAPREQWRWHERVLLLLRLLLIAALALLLAEPAWRSAAPAGPPWVVVAPGVNLNAARAAVRVPGAEWRRLAPGFPAIDAAASSGRVETTPPLSLMRQVDAELPTTTPLTLVVPPELSGLDAERLRLHRKVDWRIVAAAAPAMAPATFAAMSPGASPATPFATALGIAPPSAPAVTSASTPASAPATTPAITPMPAPATTPAAPRVAPPGVVPAPASLDVGGLRIAIRASERAAAAELPIARALVQAWHMIAPSDGLQLALDEAQPAAASTAGSVAPIPPEAGVLFWLDGGDSPVLNDWLAGGGTALASRRTCAQGQPVLRDASGEPVWVEEHRGRGRLLCLATALTPEATPLLRDPAFPRRLFEWVVAGIDRPMPDRAGANAVAPLPLDPPAPRFDPRPLDAWFVAATLLLFLAERLWATRRRAQLT